MRILIALLFAGCSAVQPAPTAPCAPVADIEAQWDREADLLIDSGVCDQAEELSRCPAWQVLNGAWAARAVAAEAQCSPQ